MFQLQIITQEQTFPPIPTDSVTIPTEDGVITVLPHHSPIFSRLKTGTVITRYKEQEHKIKVYGGFVDITPEGIKLLSDTHEHADRHREHLEEIHAVIKAHSGLAKAIIELEASDR